MFKCCPEENVSFERLAYQRLVENGQLRAFVTDHRYYSVGSHDRLPLTEELLARRPTVFLDRDGVLNRRMPRATYVCKWSEWQWRPESKEALRLLKEAGFRVMVITNQPGIARGAMTQDDLVAIHEKMKAEVQEAGGEISAIYSCPHNWDEGCGCRKPRPGMLFQAQRDYHLDLSRTFFFGDDERDVQAAQAAGCPWGLVSEEKSLLDLTRDLISDKLQSRMDNSMRSRVLITGHEGYIGSVMAPVVHQSGLFHQVTGLETGYFRTCNFVPELAPVKSIRKDLRDLTAADLEGFDAVVHLAALSNDPIGNLNREWTETINYQGSARLAALAKAAGVQRFLFSSSCIMYGMNEAAVVTEESPLDPKTEYAASKVKAELAIGQLAGDGFSPTFLRNGTVYGLSPRMRFDTVLNNLMASAVACGKVKVFSDGQPWRPVIHVQDIARSFLAVLEAPIEAVHNQVFNNGADHLNYRIIELAQIVVDTVPGCELQVHGAPGADQRTYKADFGKFARTLPDFKFLWNARTPCQSELVDAFKTAGLTNAHFTDRQFTRLAWLNHLLDIGPIPDKRLRWQEAGKGATT